jgi:hypothetical protein
LDDVGLVPALKRLNQVHLNFPATHNTMGKNFAYTLGLLGQVDTSVEADTASYGVFKNGSKRTYIAYNPTATQITVVFTDRATSKQLGLLVPPFSMASHVDGEEPQVFKQTPVVEDKLRLYLRGGGALSLTPGSFMLPKVRRRSGRHRCAATAIGGCAGEKRCQDIDAVDPAERQ